MKRALMLAVVAIASIAYAGDFGVRIDVDLPLDPGSIASFVANPLGHATTDTITLAAFYEAGPWGYRIDFQSGTEVRGGVYYRFDASNLVLLFYETSFGVYAGYNWAGEGFFIRARGTLLAYGSIP